MRRRHRVVVVALAGVGSWLVVAPDASAVVKTVDCAKTDLAPVLLSIPTNSTVKLKGTCTGNFTADKNLTLVGTPTATLNGGGVDTTLTLDGFHAYHLSHVNITGGSASDGGGIEFAGGGSLTLDHVRVTANSAVGGRHPSVAQGGGVDVRNPAFVTITNSTIANNHVSVSGTGFQAAEGGGLYVTGQLTISNSVVNGNTTQGSSTDNAGEGDGAGILVIGSMTMTATKVTNNQATGVGPTVGDSHGGGIFWSPVINDVMTVTDSTISSNHATGTSPGNAGADGGGIFMAASAFGSEPMFVKHSTLAGNQATATSSGGSSIAEGGAIYAIGSSPYPVVKVSGTTISGSSVSATGATTGFAQGGGIWLFGTGNLMRSTLTGNTVSSQSGTGIASGGGGGAAILTSDPYPVVSSTFDGNSVTGQSSQGGAVSVSGGGLLADGFRPMNVRSSTFSHNSVTTHTFGSSSEAGGGGITLLGTNTAPGDLIVNSTIVNNTVTGNGGTSPDSLGAGLSVFDKKLLLAFDTIVRNAAHTNVLPESTFGGGVYAEVDTGTTLFGNLIALNRAQTGPDCRGQVTSHGFNLFVTKSGCTLSTAAGDVANPKPKLGALADNGGPALTVALLAGSPALNRITTTSCRGVVKSDERGVARPQGAKCDEGAFEREP
ncbi:MAG TPA: choice-of-anchor Q domain-containing protein [Actinomycetota bacterium]